MRVSSPATFRFIISVSGILDRPIKPGDDSCKVMPSLRAKRSNPRKEGSWIASSLRSSQ
jgi:hypothetical protein